jgi:hypothetical protein
MRRVRDIAGRAAGEMRRESAAELLMLLERSGKLEVREDDALTGESVRRSLNHVHIGELRGDGIIDRLAETHRSIDQQHTLVAARGSSSADGGTSAGNAPRDHEVGLQSSLHRSAGVLDHAPRVVE